jgi:hypothetical protein
MYKLIHAYPVKIEVIYGKLVSKLEAEAKGNFLMEKPEIEVIMGLALYCGTSGIRDIASTVRDVACCGKRTVAIRNIHIAAAGRNRVSAERDVVATLWKK